MVTPQNKAKVWWKCRSLAFHTPCWVFEIPRELVGDSRKLSVDARHEVMRTEVCTFVQPKLVEDLEDSTAKVVHAHLSRLIQWLDLSTDRVDVDIVTVGSEWDIGEMRLQQRRSS